MLSDLHEKSPEDPDVLNDIAVAHLRSGRAAQAFPILKEGLSIAPDYYPLHVNMSRYYAGVGDLESAIRHLDQALAVHPSLAHAHELKGIHLMQLGRVDQARASFDAALANDATRTTSLVNLAFIAASIDGDWETAVAHADKAVALDPSLGRGWMLLGWARAETGDFTGADDALRRAATLEPGSPQLQAITARVRQLRAQSS